MSTAPSAACPAVADNYAYTDTVYFLPATYEGVQLINRGPVAYIVTVYACGADTTLKRH
jgi:hypothetical protein